MSEYDKLKAYLDALGLGLTTDTFSDRMTIQKVVYMLEELGADIGFKFIWYIHGPYSPELTKVYYDFPSRTKIDAALVDQNALRRLKRLLGDDIDSVDILELVSSLMVLIKYGSGSRINTKEQIYKFIKDRKPHFTIEDIDYCWDRLKTSGLFEQYFERLEGGK